MNLTGWSKSLEVTGDGEGIVSHAGLAVLRQLAGKTGLTGGLSRALASPRLLIHDRGRVTAGLACAIADGSEAISDFRVMTDQKELFGLVASVPTAWRTLDEIAAGGPRALARITRAVNAARRQAWAAVEALSGARTRAEHLSWASILGARALPPRIPRRVPLVCVACAARPQRCLERPGDLGVAA